MRGFTDIHTHFVYGMDDGAPTREAMEAMLDAAYADGITSLRATPHITPGVKPFDGARFRAHFREAELYCRSKNYPMKLQAGAELLYTPSLEQYAVDHSLPVLEDSNEVLLEFAPGISLREADRALAALERMGYAVVLAHIERYSCFLSGRNAEKVKQCHDVRYQVNANTLLGKQGFLRDRKIRSWFQRGLVDYVASDAHDMRSRTFRMKKVYGLLKERFGPLEAERLTGLK